MDKKWDRLVRKLAKMTTDGSLQWQANRTFRREGLEGWVYVASLQEKQIAAYRFGYKYYMDEDVWEWMHDTRVEFISENGETIWRFPSTVPGEALLNAIEYQSAGAEAFLNAMLAGEPEDDVVDLDERTF
jgi:hypothetical protein